MSAAIAVIAALAVLWFTRNLDRSPDADEHYRKFLGGEWR